MREISLSDNISPGEFRISVESNEYERIRLPYDDVDHTNRHMRIWDESGLWVDRNSGYPDRPIVRVDVLGRK